jgi:hypothetical protein
MVFSGLEHTLEVINVKINANMKKAVSYGKDKKIVIWEYDNSFS